jgi:hypothetical protein
LSATVSFQPGPAAVATLAASPSTVLADGVALTTLAAKLTDRFGNPIAGASLGFTVTGSGNTLAPASGTTDASGAVTATLASTRAEPKTIVVSDGNGHTATANVSFVAGAPSPGRSTLVATPATLPADGVAQATLTLALADATGNPIASQAVALSASGLRAVVAPSSGVTDATGVFIARVSSAVAGTKTLTATAGTFTLSTALQFTPVVCAGTPLEPSVPWPDIGRSPQRIASGDFNGDGKLDLVTLNSSIASVSVLLARGRGLFDAPIQLPIHDGADSPNGIVVGDFDRDSRLDIAVIFDSANRVSVFFGLGGGQFSPHVDVDLAGQWNLTDLASGDFDHDGKADLAVLETGSASTSVQILFGNAGRTFTSGPSLAVPQETTRRRIATADLDGDGFADLVTASQGSAQLFFGKPGRVFDTGAIPSLGNGNARVEAIAIGDFDRDTRPDIAIADSSDGMANKVLVLFGEGARRFSAGPTLDPHGSTFALSSVDLDGNGTLDLAVATGNTIATFLGNTNRTFTAATSPAGAWTASLAVGDLDGDGKADVAVPGDRAWNVGIFIGNGDGTFVHPPTYPTQVFGRGTIVSGDFNRDGVLDVIVTGIKGLRFFSGKGDGSFAAPILLPIGDGDDDTVEELIRDDFDHDGNLDLAAVRHANLNASLDKAVSLYYGNGDGTFTPGATLPAAGEVVSLVSGDFDHDGNVDLAVASSPGALSLFFGLDERRFDGAVALPVGPIDRIDLEFMRNLAAGDFDNDHLLDLAVADRNGVTVFYSKGDRTFTSVANVFTGQSNLASGDFNGDGTADLAVTRLSGAFIPGGLNILVGDRTRTFRTTAVFPGWQLTPVISGDFDHDGKTDLAGINLHNFGTTITTLRGNGDGTFQAPLSYGAGQDIVSLVAEDFDGDGRAEFAVAGDYWFSVLFFAGCLD